MKEKYIKYSKLSNDIREEVNKYYEKTKDNVEGLTIDDAMIYWFDNEFDEWLIERYSDGKESDKRKFFRLEVELPIKIIDTLLESNGEDEDAMILIGKVINISRGGLYFMYNKPIELSSIIKVNIDLAEIEEELKSIEALAMVVRLDKYGEGEYGVGVVFSSIYDYNKESLDIFLLKNLSSYIYPSTDI
jgi:hypothetical protein